MFGPDGKPIPIGAAPLIGGPKSLDDVEPFNDDTIDALADGAVQLLASGQPMGVPAAMPLGQIIQIAKTLVALRDRVRELEEAMEGELVEGGDGLTPLPPPDLPDLSGLMMP